MWKLMAGRGSAFVQTFLDRSIIAGGWRDLGDTTELTTREMLTDRYRATRPDLTAQQVATAAGQAWRFLSEVKVGDLVLVYDPQSRDYHVCQVEGAARYDPAALPDLPTMRPVRWVGKIARDSLSADTRNSLGAILTLFRLPAAAEAEVRSRVIDGAAVIVASEVGATSVDAPEQATDPFAAIEEQALERLKDRLLRLEWDEMQDVVAALLRALGYRTMVSPAGPDRGKDIVASRDGFGFERPRNVVEVKHRRGAMGAQEIRSFLGGRHADDRGLYVSTGGFTRDAQYEAERASTVTHLMNLDGLARAVLDQYERLDQQGRRLLPMTRLYWPA